MYLWLCYYWQMRMKSIFKSFKVFDIVALSLFLGIMVMAYFFMMRKASYVNIVLRVSQSDLINANTGGVSAALPAWYLENLKPENGEINSSDISIVKAFQYQNNSNEKIVYLTLRLLATYDKRSGIYTYGGLPLLVGSYQNFKFKGMLLRGIVQKVGGIEEKREEKTFLVDGVAEVNYYESKGSESSYTLGQIENYSKLLYPGLSISNSDDQVILKVEEVKIEPAYVKLISNGRLITVEDRDNKTVKVKMKIKVEKFDDVYLFSGEKTVKIGEVINLDFWNFNARVRITSLKEVL